MSNTHTTTSHRDDRGKVFLETTLPIDLPNRKEGVGELFIRTYSPAPNKITSYAQVSWVRGNISTTSIYGDYHRTLAVQYSPARVAVMKEQHTRVVNECANLIIQEATAWYQNKRE